MNITSLHQKGTPVISIEHIAKTPSVKTGLFATLRACLHGAGSGASSLDRRLTSTMLATLCALAGVLVFAAAPTFAARGHAFGSAFGEKGSGNGQFEEPSGVAVSEASGDVYVVDKGNNRVEYFSASGTYLGQFNGSGLLLNEGKAAGSGGLSTEIPTGRFSSPEGIAVDNSCQLHKPVLTEATTPTCAEFDPSNGDVYVADTNNKVVDKFSATGEYVGQLTQTPSGVFEELYGVAVDVGGHVFVQKRNLGFDEIGGDAAEFDDSFVNVFVADNEFVDFEGFPVAGPAFAVDSQDESYMLGRRSAEEEFVNKQKTDGVPLFTMHDTDQPTGLAVDLSSNELYVDHVGVVTRFSANLTPGDAPLERFGTGHLSSGSGIGIGPKGQTIYVADSTADVVDIFVLEPPAAPTLGATSVSDVTAEGVTVQGELNPRGASTKYRLEYGRCATPTTCAGSPYEASTPVPDAPAGSSFEIQSIDVHAQGLQASTAYHARIVAANEFGGVEGEEQTFTTQAVGSAGVALADGRQWELVSPPNKHGARIFPIATGAAGVYGLTQAAEAGGGIAYLADIPTEAEPPANGYGDGSQVLSVRGGDGWSTRDIATPHSSLTQISVFAEYRFFTGDLSSALATPTGLDETLLSPEASEPTPYVRTEALCEARGTASECYRPVLSDKEGFADVPPGTKFGTNKSRGGATTAPVTFSGASPDLRHVLLKSLGVALTNTPIAAENIYEWSADAPASEALRMVSLLPANEGGGPAPLKVNVGSSNSEIEGSNHSISDDGSRIFWQSDEGSGDFRPTFLQRLYMRDTVKEETVRIDVPQAGVPVSGQPEATFKDASADGSRVVFTDGQRLTSDSGTEPDHRDLYECDIFEEAGKLACRLTDLTPEVSGRSADVRNVFGASADASYVYFIANGILSANKNSLGEEAAPGTCGRDGGGEGQPEFSHEVCGLYVYHGGVITFIANVTQAFLFAGHAVVRGSGTYTSPNGQFMTFATRSRLAGYDNRDAVSGKLDSEVYLYDAQAGRLTCVSCNPTGARPSGPGILPATPELDHNHALYQPRAVSDAGRVFFDSTDGLVSQDVNSSEDVYEFEPEGTGSCTAASTAFNAKSDGCLSLISSGTSSEPSSFLDASVSGNDVFFLTAAKLTSQDVDDAGDVYDAHVCTSAVPCVTQPVPAPPCSTGDACKAAPAPQPSIFGEPASATFTGAGNVAVSPPSLGLKRRSLTRAEKLTRALRACRKKPKRARSACVRQARKRYGVGGARRAVRSTTKGQG